MPALRFPPVRVMNAARIAVEVSGRVHAGTHLGIRTGLGFGQTLSSVRMSRACVDQMP